MKQKSKKKSKKIVITYGTFDMFHIGHLKLLKKLRKMGGKLIVAVSTDEFNELKGKKTLIPYDQRAAIVSAIKYVDKVIPEENWEQKVDDIQKHNVDIFAIGNDWKGKFDFLKKHCDVVYTKRTKGVSTTKLKKSLNKFLSVSKEEMILAFSIIEKIRDELK